MNGTNYNDQNDIDQFREALAQHGIVPPADLAADGQRRIADGRFIVLYHGEGMMVGYHGPLPDGPLRPWCSKPKGLRTDADAEFIGQCEAKARSEADEVVQEATQLHGEGEHEHTSPLLSYEGAALRYAAQGCPVFPLKPGGKAPLTPHGFKDATTDHAVIRDWWAQWPDANIGIVTGRASGLVVIDVDVKDGRSGMASLDQLEARYGPFDTFKVRTPSGGLHLCFNLPPGCPDLGSGNGVMPGIDVRADGGYIVARPSVVDGVAYCWENTTPPAPLPEGLMGLFAPSASANTPAPDVRVEDLRVPEEIKQLIREGKPTGERSEALFGAVRAMILCGHDGDEIIGVLMDPANGLSEKPREQGRAWLEGEIRRARTKPGDPKRADSSSPKTGRANPLASIISAAELATREFPEQRWIVPGIIPEGLSLLAGKSKCGKSWLALQTAVDVANVGGDVLYLALEDTQHRLQDRLSQVCGDGTPPERLYLASQSNWYRLDSGGLKDIRQWLQEHSEARLIIVDTLAKVKPQGQRNGNSYGEDYAALEGLKQLADEFRVAILVVHHTRKMPDSDDPFNEISGTTGLMGCADTAMVLKRPRGSNQANLFVTGRDVEEQKMPMTWDPDLCRWEEAHAPLSAEHQAIIDLLRERGPLTMKEIVDAASPISPGTTKSRLSRMVANGHIVNREGKYFIVEK
ncbi:hypothetical protein GCM10027419_51240 [Pandoraea terrae]